MVETSSTDEFNVYLFQMAISVAHEMGHFLTGFLTGSARPRTPPLVTVPGAGAEAGYWWEVRALGGIVEFYSDPRRPNSPGRRASSRYIESLVFGDRGMFSPSGSHPLLPLSEVPWNVTMPLYDIPRLTLASQALTSQP